MAFPKADAELVPYSTNWNERLTESAESYGLTVAQQASYTAVHNPYIMAVAALEAARQSGVQSQPLVAARNDARQALLAVGRELYAFVQANTAVRDSLKIELNVVVRDHEPTPSPVPVSAPVMSVLGVTGRNLYLSVQGNTTDRARLKGTIAGQVFYHVGAEAPASVDDWKWLANVGRSPAMVTLPTDVAAGSKVWLTGFWVNTRKESGPLSEPFSTYLGGGVSQAA